MFEDFRELIGLKIVDIRAFITNLQIKKTRFLLCILFDDEKTILLLEEQDPRAYHDPAFRVREIRKVVDPKLWTKINKDEKTYSKI